MDAGLYVKTYDQLLVRDVPNLNLSPCWFKLSKNAKSFGADGLNMFERKLKPGIRKVGCRTDFAIGKEMIDWSLHEKLLATIPFIYPQIEKDVDTPLVKQSLIWTWITSQLTMDTSPTWQSNTESVLLGKEILFNFELDMGCGIEQSSSLKSSDKNSTAEDSTVEIIFLLAADFGDGDQKSSFEISIPKGNDEQSRSAGSKLLKGKSCMGKPVSFDYIDQKKYDVSSAVAISSLHWMETAASEALNSKFSFGSLWYIIFFCALHIVMVSDSQVFQQVKSFFCGLFPVRNNDDTISCCWKVV